MKTRTLFDRYIARVRKAESSMHPNQHVRAELQRLARQVRNIRKELNAPTCEVDAGYKTALNDVLAMLKDAKK